MPTYSDARVRLHRLSLANMSVTWMEPQRAYGNHR